MNLFWITPPESLAAEEKRSPKYNVLFCFADDWGRYASCLAALEHKPGPNSIVKTPNIDSVAKKGAIFRNAFVNAPSCTPCRSSLLTGRYFFTCNRAAILSGATWQDNWPAFPLLLKDNGWHIGKTSKVWSPGTPADAPFGNQTYSYQKGGMRFNNFSEQVTQLVSDGKSIDDAKADLLKEVHTNFNQFLDDRKSDQPFFYFFGPTTVHRTWIKGSGKNLWKIDPESLKGKLPANLPDVPEVREDFADYLGEVQAYDAYIGELLNALRERGEADKTMIVISGDHGAPGFPGGKCNLYDFGIGVALITSHPNGKGGRVVDDFVNLMDLCPTFLANAGIDPPTGVQGKSILSQILSDQSGQIDADRTFIIAGRERHVGGARIGNLPYPHRAYRTKDYLYIRNFAPDRTPMGDSFQVTDDSTPSQKELETNTRAAFPDMDAGPTKAWLILNRNDPKWKWHFDYAFAKRPGEELYDLKNDPDQIKNLAGSKEYQSIQVKLGAELLAKLKAAGDPRVVESECRFDRAPFTDPESKGQPKKKKK